MATNVAFLAAIRGLEIVGVTRPYPNPPAKLNSADLPAFFPLLPEASLGQKLVSCWSENKTRSMQCALPIRPIGQATPSLNYDELAPLMDNLETAFDGLEKSQGGTLANFIEYEISAEIITVAGVDYLGLLATISARDV